MHQPWLWVVVVNRKTRAGPFNGERAVPPEAYGSILRLVVAVEFIRTHQKMLSTVLRSQTALRALHTSTVLRNQKWSQLTNILASEIPPPVQVKSISAAGLLLQDGRLLPSACIFLEGEVLLWDVPGTLWNGWDESRFEVFDVVVPKPGSCLQFTFA
jgi:hypothetical protein